MYQDMAARHRARFRSIHVRNNNPPPNRPPNRSIVFMGEEKKIKKRRLTSPTDPPRRRAREGRRCQAPLHQAAPHQEPGLPPAPPRPQDQHQEGLLRHPAVHFRLGNFPVRRCMICGFSAWVWWSGRTVWDDGHGALLFEREYYHKKKNKQRARDCWSAKQNGFSPEVFILRDQRLVISIFCSKTVMSKKGMNEIQNKKKPMTTETP